MLPYLVAFDSTWLPRNAFCADMVEAIVQVERAGTDERTMGMHHRDLMGCKSGLILTANRVRYNPRNLRQHTLATLPLLDRGNSE